VPHVLGVYLATGWAFVEVTAFLVGRYKLTDNLVDIVLAGLLLLVPAVLVLAWNRFGRDEGDRLTRAEVWACVLNVVLAGGVIFALFGNAPIGRATTTVAVTDASGAEVQREIPRADLLRSLIVFNPSANSAAPVPEWAASAFAATLMTDLAQDRFVVPNRPVMPRQIERLREGGGDIGLAARKTMAAIARESEAQMFLAGELGAAGEGFRARIEIYAAEPTRLLAEVRAEGPDLYALVDQLTPLIRSHLDLAAERASAADDLPVRDLMTPSVEALAEFGRSDVAVFTSNDFAASLVHLERALELDPQFASAGLTLAMASYLTGQGERARTGLDAALRGIERLIEPQQFMVRSFDAELRGDIDASERLRRTWVDLYPSDPTARQMLAGHLAARGSRVAEALVHYEALRGLGSGFDWALLQIGTLKRSLGDLEGAARAYEEYRRLHPEQAEPLLRLADLRVRLGERRAAESLLRDAAATPEGGIQARLELAELLADEGRDAEADAEFGTTQALASGDQDQLAIGRQRVGWLIEQGRRVEARAQLEQIVALTPAALQTLERIGLELAFATYATGSEHDALQALIRSAFPDDSDPGRSLRAQWHWIIALERDDRPAFASAATALDAMIERHRRDDFRFLARVSAGRLAELDGDHAAAASHFRAALDGLRASANGATMISQARLLRFLLRAQRAAGDLAGASASAAELERLVPAGVGALTERAELALAQGDAETARVLAERALARLQRADPDYPPKQRLTALLESVPAAGR
jgi:hypothetical protein